MRLAPHRTVGASAREACDTRAAADRVFAGGAHDTTRNALARDLRFDSLTLPVVPIPVRPQPVSQHLSWWKLEQSGMAWGSSMGLGEEYLKPPARLRYPPASLRDAIKLSRDADVAALWASAADLGSGMLPRLPEWAAPFPNGQVATVAAPDPTRST